MEIVRDKRLQITNQAIEEFQEETQKPTGRCCGSVLNEKAFRYILFIDIIFILILPRTIFAIMGLFKERYLRMYVRFRELSFFVIWPIAFLIGIIYIAKAESVL